MPEHADDVARYYDENTAAFLARGEGGSEGVLHRAVWGQGVVDRAGALHYVHELILREIDTLGSPRPRILDLGCGVGGSLLYLLERRDAEGFGITVSGEQYERARRRGNGQWLRGDFCRDLLPAEVDLAYGIESFVHGSDARAFFGNVSRALRPGGRLVLVDDFLTSRVPKNSSAPCASGASPARLRADERPGRGGGAPRHYFTRETRDQTPVRDFIWGWHATSLLRPDEVDAMATAAGLTLLSERDLTPHLSLDRPRDRALAFFLPLVRSVLSDGPRVRSLVGGNALRKGLKQGFIEYRFRVWENLVAQGGSSAPTSEGGLS